MATAAPPHPLLRRENRARVCGGAALLWVLLMLATPRVPHSAADHLFADMRNLLGVPNTLNVLTSFPFLAVGVPGLVLCLSGGFFRISLKGEVWGWALFYTGLTATAFGSAYYHLKPDDDRVIWERLPMMISTMSLLSILLIERVDERVGRTCLFSLLMFVLVSIAFERIFDDLRLSLMFHLIPCIAIPVMIFLLPPKYTHSNYWFWATGFYLLARFESIADRKVYSMNHYIISGHSLEHLCLAMGPVLLTVMLWCRNIKLSSIQCRDQRIKWFRTSGEAVFNAGLLDLGIKAADQTAQMSAPVQGVIHFALVLKEQVGLTALLILFMAEDTSPPPPSVDA